MRSTDSRTTDAHVNNVGLRAGALVAFLLLDSKLLNGHNLEKIVTEKGSLLAFKTIVP